MSRRRSILFTFVTLGPGGIERGVCNILHQLNRQSFDSRLFLLHRPESELNGRIPTDVPVSWGSNRQRYSRWQLPRMFFGLLRRAQSCDVIVAAEEGRATVLAFLVGLLLRKPVVGMINFDWQAFGQTVRRRQKWALRTIYPRLAMTVVCGEGALKAFRRMVPMPDGKVMMIRYVIPFDNILAEADHPLPPWAEEILRKPTIVSVGRLETQKNFPMLIRAHAQLRRAGSDHNLLILGKGSLRGRLKQLAAELGVRSSVHLAGHVSNPHQFVRRATAFAMSSAFEGYPLALAEALACGVPTVCADCPSGPAEILDHGKYGVLVPPDDEQALAAALEKILRDPDHRTELQHRARQGAALSSPRQAMCAWENLLRRIGRKTALTC